jgi:hypothetical protein
VRDAGRFAEGGPRLAQKGDRYNPRSYFPTLVRGRRPDDIEVGQHTERLVGAMQRRCTVVLEPTDDPL